MVIVWTLYLLLFWYVQKYSKPAEGIFDPFKILGVQEDASESEIKKAYRKLSLQYHPDKNPDPEATTYFAEYVTKAYKALTDEVSRENYIKYGHPDGKQAVSLSVALPEWFFSKDKEAAPAILLTLLLGGIVLPLGLAAWYMGRSQRYAGPNEVLHDTLLHYSHPKFGIKQKQGVSRLLDTFVIAKEFLELPLTSEQGAALRELRPILSRHYAELQEKPKEFYEKRHPKLVKVHMILLAHMARLEIPPVLKKDADYIFKKAPALLQEMYNASLRCIFTGPRIRPHYGWLAPACGTVELMQCLIQAVSPEERKKAGVPGKSCDAPAALLQLPHFTDDYVRKLAKKKIRNLGELQALEKVERCNALQSIGFAGNEAEDVETTLSALPSVFVSAKMEIRSEGVNLEEAWAYSDIVTVTVWSLLMRPSHQDPGFNPDSIKGKAPLAYAPLYPYPREEHWFLLVADPATGALLAWKRLSLNEAEVAGARYAAGSTIKSSCDDNESNFENSNKDNSASDNASDRIPSQTDNKKDGPSGIPGQGLNNSIAIDTELLQRVGQEEELQFLAPMVGKHDLVLYVMPDSWLGADRAIPLGRLKTVEPTRAQREGRAGRFEGTRANVSVPDSKNKDSNSESEAKSGDEQETHFSDQEEEDEVKSSDEEDEEGDPEWDSDEYGTEETASDIDTDDDSMEPELMENAK